MAVVVRACLLLLSVFLVSACGSEDVAQPGASRSSSVEADGRDTPAPPDNPGDDNAGGSDSTPPPQDDEVIPPPTDDPEDEEPVEEDPIDETPDEDVPPVDVPDDEVEPPPQATLDTNIFFPIIPGMQLYFDNNPVPTVLGAGQLMGTDLAYPLQHDDILSNYFTSTAATVGLKGIHVLLIDNANPVYLNMVFNESRPILGNAASYDTTGSAVIRVTGVPISLRFPVRLTATLAADEWVNIGGLAPQPARRIQITQRLAVSWLQRVALLLAYPWLAPIFDPVAFSLQLVPGIGVVGVQMGNLSTQVQSLAGVPEPLVFAVLRNGPVDASAPQTLLVDGEAITDMASAPEIFYRTAATDWLDVAFDETGSWRARITRSDLARGIHAATVRFGTGDQARDVTVSLMVE